MSDFRTDIATIVKGADILKPKSSAKAHYYPNIPEKVMQGIKKGISGDIGIATVAAVIDTSLLENGKSGIVFTTNGVYYKDILVKKIYFNYRDLETANYDGIYIKLSFNDRVYDMSNVSVDEHKTISLLTKLKNYVNEQGLESRRSSGVMKKEKMPKDLYNKCNVIIHGASVSCGAVGAGMAQLPCADTVPITTAQVGMIIALGQVFELNITDGVARGILTGMAGSYIGRGIVQVAFGWIPGAGNVINTATAAGLTEVIGWATAAQFYNQSLDNTIQYSYDGEVKGFKDASEIYEKKLRDQAQHFIEQKAVLEEERDELNNIINEYEVYISEHLSDKQVTISLMQNEIKVLKNIRDAS